MHIQYRLNGRETGIKPLHCFTVDEMLNAILVTETYGATLVIQQDDTTPDYDLPIIEAHWADGFLATTQERVILPQ